MSISITINTIIENHISEFQDLLIYHLAYKILLRRMCEKADALESSHDKLKNALDYLLIVHPDFCSHCKKVYENALAEAEKIK